MSGIQLNIKPPNQGEVITADFLQQVAAGVNRHSKFFEGPAIANSAGVFPRKVNPDSSTRSIQRRVFQLDANFHRTASGVTAQIMRWGGSDFDQASDVRHTLDGKFYRGFSFEGDQVIAERWPGTETWFAVGVGHRLVRGTLDGDLSNGGTQTMTLTEFTGSSWSVISPTKQVTVREAVGLEQDVDSGDVMWATWYDEFDSNIGFWLATLAPCPATASA